MVGDRLFDAIVSIPRDLLEEVAASFFVPQLGDHNEGPFLYYHLAIVYYAINKAEMGEFHDSVPDAVKPLMERAAKEYRALVAQYVLLHDLDASNCLTFYYGDGDPLVLSRKEWDEMLERSKVHFADPDEIRTFFNVQGITKIAHDQYRFGGEIKVHGKVTADRLRERDDISDLVVRAIETHEISLTFAARGGVDIKLMADTFGQWGKDEIGFALLVNYADQMASLGKDGGQDITRFLDMAKSYLAWMKFNEAWKRLFAMALNTKALQHELDALRDSPTAFETETVDEVVARIKKSTQ